jgi:hypothetical protein
MTKQIVNSILPPNGSPEASQIGIYGAADAAQMENGKCKIENDGVRFAHDLKSFP